MVAKHKKSLEDVLKDLILILEQDIIKVLILANKKGQFRIKLIKPIYDTEDEEDEDEDIEYIPKQSKLGRASYMG